MPTGTIVTFYSWKGGVGRSMALANIGVQLAQRGRSVLMVDWDLEAPGLDRYFYSKDAVDAGVVVREPPDRSGLAGLLHGAVVSQAESSWRSRIKAISVPKLTAPAHGTAAPTPNLLHMLASGEEATGFAEKLASFSWSAFYADANGASFLEELRTDWLSSYDFVLIDSRTGLTDAGGVCTIHMPDWLVLVFTSNEQSLEGGLRMVAGIQRARQDFAFDRMPLNVLPLLSRWDGDSEVDLAASWLDRAAESTKELFAAWLPATLKPRLYFERVRVPHLARFSFGEPLPVVTHSVTDEALPGVAYARIASLFDSGFADAGKIIDPSYSSSATMVGSPLFHRENPELLSIIIADEAEFSKELRLQEQKAGGETEVFATYLLDMGKLLRKATSFTRAHSVFRRALNILESLFGPDDPRVGVALSDLAGLLRETNRRSEAEPLYVRALAIDERHFGPDHPEVATDLINLAGLLRDNNRLKEAEPLYIRALGIDESHFGPDHPEVAKDLNNYATFLLDTNRHREAEPLLRRALAIAERHFGPHHTEVAIDLNNLAGLLRDTGRLKEAEPLFRRSIAIEEANYGPDHPSIAVGLNNLAGLLREIDRDEEAEQLLRRALAIDEASYGPDHPKISVKLNNLAGLFRDTGRVADAEAFYRRALAIDEASYGADHPEVATDLNNLASLLLLSSDQQQEAEELLRRSIKIDENSYGANHPRVSVKLNNLAGLLRDKAEYYEAEILYRRALSIDESSFGEYHPKIATRLNNLAVLLGMTNREVEAEPLMQRAIDIALRARDTAGYSNREAELLTDNYAKLLEEMGRPEEQVRSIIASMLRVPDTD